MAERKLHITHQMQSWVSEEPRVVALPIKLRPMAFGTLDQDQSREPTSPEDRAAWQSGLRDRITQLGGSSVVYDGARAPEFRVLSDKTLPSKVRQLLVAFESFDGTEIPAYVHTPENSQSSRPGILVIPGHVGGNESGIEQLANQSDSYQRAAARRLAEAGMTTLTFELRGFGYLGKPANTEHRIVAYNAILAGTSYKWTSLRDVGFAMALLKSLPYVDKSKIGLTGTSYGGELAVYYAALDPAVNAVVFNSFSAGRGPKTPMWGYDRKQPHYCHVLPRIDRLVAQEEWIWLLAPRPVLGIRGSQNHPFGPQDSAVLGAPWAADPDAGEFHLSEESGGHEFFVEPTLKFFRSTLSDETP